MNRLSLAIDVWRSGRSSSRIAARQRMRLADLVRHARRHSPYYADRYAGLPEDIGLHRLPVVHKADLMAHFDDWVSDPAIKLTDVRDFADDPGNVGRPFLGRYLVFTTSGTTGTPALLLQDRRTLDVLEALTLIRAAPSMIAPPVIAGIVRRGGRTASVWATGRPFGGASLAQRQIFQRPSRARRIRLLSALTPVEQLVDQLNALDPGMVSGYATVLSLLAREQQAGRLHIHPAVLNSGGETLTPEAERLIRAAFGARVFNNYGCSEMVMIAYDCGHGGLHVHADWVILEPIDEHGRPVPVGTASTSVLLTNLANRVQPLIRYDLGDAVAWKAERCPCGSVLPAIEVAGRTNDVLRFPGPGRATVEVLPLALITLVEGCPGVRSVQILQRSTALVVRLDVTADHDREQVWRLVRSRLQQHLAERRLDAVQLWLDTDPPQRSRGSGKLRQVIAEQPA